MRPHWQMQRLIDQQTILNYAASGQFWYRAFSLLHQTIQRTLKRPLIQNVRGLRWCCLLYKTSDTPEELRCCGRLFRPRNAWANSSR